MGFTALFDAIRKSFRAKIFVMAALIIVITSCSFTIFFVNYNKNTQTAELARQGELLASLLAYNTRLGIFAADKIILDEAAESLMRYQDILSVALYDRTGNLLAHRTKQEGASFMPRRTIQLPQSDQQGHSQRIIHDKTIEIFSPIFAESSRATADSLFFGRKQLKPDQAVIGSVRVIVDKTNLDKKLNHLVLLAAISMALFLLLGSAFAYLLARGITRPLTALMEGVDALGAGGVYPKVAVETTDEIGGLAKAFNKMVDSLKRREQENRDLEEQLRLAQKKEAQEEWERTFDTVPDLIAILGQDQRIVRVNRAMAKHFRISKEEAIGLRCEEIGSDCAILNPAIINQNRQAKNVLFEGEVNEKEGGKWYWLTISPLHKLTGEVSGAVHVARDITLRKKAEADKKALQAKLIQTNKMTSLGLLVSGMAHEVNNPNSNIMFTAHLLAKAWNDAEGVLDRYMREEGDFRIGGHWYSEIRESLPQHIAGIRENSRRIEGIINNLKDFVRRGKADLTTEMDVNRIISVAASLINNQIKHYSNNFHLQLTENLPTVRGNPQQLEQVFINLIMNSLQALPDKKSSVRVSTFCDRISGFVVVRIDDEGCGMTPDIKANIFEPFFSTKLESGGTGLGLAISKFILDEHNAHIEFDSEPGKGTTFTILLPVRRQFGLSANLRGC